jgi:hypothetical protein
VAWGTYYRDWIIFAGNTGDPGDIMNLLATMEHQLEGERELQREFENDRARFRGAAEQDRASEAIYENPDAISGGDLNEPVEPVTYTEVTDQIVDPIFCPAWTWTSINNSVEDSNASGGCF